MNREGTLVPARVETRRPPLLRGALVLVRIAERLEREILGEISPQHALGEGRTLSRPVALEASIQVVAAVVPFPRGRVSQRVVRRGHALERRGRAAVPVRVRGPRRGPIRLLQLVRPKVPRQAQLQIVRVRRRRRRRRVRRQGLARPRVREAPPLRVHDRRHDLRGTQTSRRRVERSSRRGFGGIRGPTYSGVGRGSRRRRRGCRADIPRALAAAPRVVGSRAGHRPTPAPPPARGRSTPAFPRSSPRRPRGPRPAPAVCPPPAPRRRSGRGPAPP